MPQSRKKQHDWYLSFRALLFIVAEGSILFMLVGALVSSFRIGDQRLADVESILSSPLMIMWIFFTLLSILIFALYFVFYLFLHIQENHRFDFGLLYLASHILYGCSIACTAFLFMIWSGMISF